MLHALDLHSLDAVVCDEIAIHASFLEERAASAPPTPDPQELEHLLRQNCRDLIAASYDHFQTAVLENPFGTVYEVQKQQAIAALKEELRVKAAAASSAEERQVYLNYARVAHLQFAQKAKQLDAVVAQCNQDVPEPQHYACSTTGYTSSSSGVCGGLAALSMGLLGMATRRTGGRKVSRGIPEPSQTLVPPESLSVSYTHGEDPLPVDGAEGVLVDDESAVVTLGFDLREDRPYSDHSGESRAAKAEADKVFVEWDETSGSGGENDQDIPTHPGIKVLPALPIAVPLDDNVGATEEVPKPKYVQLPSGSPRRSIIGILADAALYSTFAFAATATAALLIYNALTSSHPDVSPKHEVVASYTSHAPSVSPPESLQDSVPSPEQPSGITYSPAVAPAYDAENPAPWYQIEKADLSNNGRTLDLRLGPHLSMERRTVRLTYDVNGDGKADRTTYVDSQEQLTITVPGNIIDVGVGFRNEEQPGFIYHCSVRFERKNAV